MIAMGWKQFRGCFRAFMIAAQVLTVLAILIAVGLNYLYEVRESGSLELAHAPQSSVEITREVES